MNVPAYIASAYTCRVGAHVRLSASLDRDPRVLLWTTREALSYFIGGNWNSTVRVMGDTVVLASGTEAIISQCDDEQGFLGVRVTIGTHRGRYGWVRGSDVAP